MSKDEDDDWSPEQIEKNYWRKILEGKLEPAYYAIDNDFSLFRDKTKLLNLNRLTDNQSLIHGVSCLQFIKIGFFQEVL